MILSSGIIPVRKHEGSTEFLMLRCYNYWDFPKGECPDGEDPLQCALRELKEETSIEEITMPWGKDYYETAPYSKGKIARYYLGFLQNDPVIRLSFEHHEHRWVDEREALKLANDRIKLVIKWAQDYHLRHDN